MEGLISSVSLEQLGVSAILVAYLLYVNHCLRTDLNAEREYSKAQDERHHNFALKSVESMGNLEAAFHALKDAIR